MPDAENLRKLTEQIEEDVHEIESWWTALVELMITVGDQVRELVNEFRTKPPGEDFDDFKRALHRATKYLRRHVAEHEFAETANVLAPYFEEHAPTMDERSRMLKAMLHDLIVQIRDRRDRQRAAPNN